MTCKGLFIELKCRNKKEIELMVYLSLMTTTVFLWEGFSPTISFLSWRTPILVLLLFIRLDFESKNKMWSTYLFSLFSLLLFYFLFFLLMYLLFLKKKNKRKFLSSHVTHFFIKGSQPFFMARLCIN